MPVGKIEPLKQKHWIVLTISQICLQTQL